MSYHEEVETLAQDPARLEQVYAEASEAGQGDAFKQAIDESYASAPDNLLYAAWFHRLNRAAERTKGFVVAWAWVIPLALVNGVLFWWLSDSQLFMIELAGASYADARDFAPVISILAGPLAACSVMIYLTVVGGRRWPLTVLLEVGLGAASAYVLLTFPRSGPQPFQMQYLSLMIMHLALLSWAGLGVLLISDHRDPVNRFAFLTKSLEVAVMGGLFAIAGGLFTAITIGLFDALDIQLPELVQRLFIAGGGGVIPVVATAVIYDPTVPPARQAFDEGLSKLVALLGRTLLLLSLVLLIVYLGFIPFNFRAPLNNREVLITYNAMQFAVMALLVGATPVRQADVSPRLRRWLRRAISTVAALALIVSLYALGAILYRTTLDRITPNRLTFIGWNVINIGLLGLVLLGQARATGAEWLMALKRTFSVGTVAYVVWTLAMILAIPWLFGINQGVVAALPGSVQEIIHEEPSPILLTCPGSPHIYLLQRGEKRWIETIDTFEERGYVWGDVQTLPCEDLRAVPDGTPIPVDAGPPPR